MEKPKVELEIAERNFASGCKVRTSNLRVLQWNILADGLSGSSPTENFCAVPQEYLEWKYRSKLIEKQLQTLDADIVCLEEVDHFSDFLEPVLSSKGFSGQFLEKKNSPCLNFPNNNGPDGVAMFFKKDKFDVLETFEEYINSPEDNTRSNPGFLVKVLRHKELGKIFTVAVSHLKAKREFHAMRLSQTRTALRKLSEISARYKDAPVIWCGDFNAETNEDCFKEIMQSNFELKSSYQTYLNNEPAFTTWKIRPKYTEKRTIDYIFCNKVSVKDVLLPMEEGVVPDYRFPSFNHPSDHICLCVDFDFLPKK